MANQAGKSMSLSVESSTPGTYLSLGGLTTRNFRLNAASIDVTDSDSTDLFTELLDGGGVKSMEISASGHSKDDSAIMRLKDRFLTGALTNFRGVVPSFAQFECAFYITSFEMSGNHDGAVDFSLSIQSSGKPTVTNL